MKFRPALEARPPMMIFTASAFLLLVVAFCIALQDPGGSQSTVSLACRRSFSLDRRVFGVDDLQSRRAEISDA